MFAMITNGPGGHPAWKHAQVTAAKIVVFDRNDPNISEEKREAAAKLQRRLEEVLIPHHQAVRAHELGKISEHGSERLSHPLQPHDDHVAAVMETIATETKGTALEEHFAKPDVLRIIREEIVGHEFRSQMHVHRCEHADGALKSDPADAHAKAFRDRHHGDDIVAARAAHADAYPHAYTPPTAA